VLRAEGRLGREPAVAVVVNPGAGGAGGAELPGSVRQRGLTEGESLRAALCDLADRGVDVLGVCGGDGSQGCAADVAADRDLVMWPIPGGTLNHFPRTIGFDTVEDAVQGLARGRVARVDLGEADGTVFVNNASLGMYGDLVRRRETLERRLRLGKWPALALAVALTVRRARPLELELDGRRERAFLLFVGNNRYEGLGTGGRTSLQRGLLDVIVLRAPGRAPRLTVAVAALTGVLPRTPLIWRRQAARLAVRLGRPACLAHDGEVRDDVSGEIVFRSRPGAVRAIVP
jgi:undecaprenyl-diphosphatase